MDCNFVTASMSARERNLFPNSKVISHSKVDASVNGFILQNQLSLFYSNKETNFVYKLSKQTAL